MASSSSITLQTLARNAKQIDELLNAVRCQYQLLFQQSTIAGINAASSAVVYTGKNAPELNALSAENATLRAEIAKVKSQLEEAEKRNGHSIEVQIPPSATAETVSVSTKSVGKGKKYERIAALSASSSAGDAAVDAVGKTIKSVQSAKPAVAGSSSSSPSEQAKGKAKQENTPVSDVEDDVSHLDLRVGRIVSAKKHPDADSLYVEEVDLNEGKLRTVVSGLVKHIPLEDMQNRLAILLCNLKPAKMRGVTSEAMVMCASSEAKVEILDPPAGSAPGDRVEFEGFSGKPDEQLNPKKKTWEAIQPHLKTNGDRIATYKGVPFAVKGKGVVTAPSLTNTMIK